MAVAALEMLARGQRSLLLPCSTCLAAAAKTVSIPLSLTKKKQAKSLQVSGRSASACDRRRLHLAIIILSVHIERTMILYPFITSDTVIGILFPVLGH